MKLSTMNRRGVLTIGALLFASHANAQALPCPPPRVLFVCPAGTVKSAIARETLRRRAAQRGVAVRVQSRGVHPEDHVSPALAAQLSADGIDPRSEPVQSLAAADISGNDVIIAFDEAAQAPGLGQARVWDVPSWNTSYAAAKSALAVQVDALLDELGAKPCRR
jgi:hypothetical protein